MPEEDVEMEDQTSPAIAKRRGIVRKFWKSDESQEEWRTYILGIEQFNICQLYFASEILIFQTKAYI